MARRHRSLSCIRNTTYMYVSRYSSVSKVISRTVSLLANSVNPIFIFCTSYDKVQRCPILEPKLTSLELWFNVMITQSQIINCSLPTAEIFSRFDKSKFDKSFVRRFQVKSVDIEIKVPVWRFLDEKYMMETLTVHRMKE